MMLTAARLVRASCASRAACARAALSPAARFSTAPLAADADADDVRAAASLSVPASTSWKGVPRFYATVTASAVEGAAPGEHCVLIDGRPARTHGARALLLPSRALALAIAGEFAAQRGVVRPATMPLYNLACAALDAYAEADAKEGAAADALARAARLAAFDRFDGPGGAAALAAAAALEPSAPAHAALGTGRGSAALSSDGASGAAKLRDVMLDSLETDTVCFRVDWEAGGDPAEATLKKRQDKCGQRAARGSATADSSSHFPPRLVPCALPGTTSRCRSGLRALSA
jgi:hypothetical protein